MIGVVYLVDFGDKMKELRKRSGLSQYQLAQRLGITKSMVSSYETSMRMPSYPILIKIAKIFNVSIDFLLGLSENETLNISGLSEKQKTILYEIISQFKEKNIE